MRSFWPCLVVILAGLVVAAGSAVALAGSPPARGGPALSVTTKAPPLQKQGRGYRTYPAIALIGQDGRLHFYRIVR
jgi:hypothetical protein